MLIYIGDRYENALDIPYPERREVIDELRGHLEDLREETAAPGVTAAELERRAWDALAADGAFVDSIQSVHQTAIAHALARLPRRVSLGIEYGAATIIGTALFTNVIALEAPMLEFMVEGGFFMFPLNLAGLMIVVLGVERLYSLFLKKDHSPQNLHKRILSLRFLGIVCAMTGFIGTLTGFYSAFSQVEMITEKFAGVFPIYEIVRIAMITTIWGFTLALVSVLFRYVIEAKVSRIDALRSA